MKQLKLDTAPNIIVLLFTQIIVGLLLYLLSGNFASVGWQGRVAAFAAPFLLIPILFVVFLFIEPITLDSETQSKITDLQEKLFQSSNLRETKEELSFFYEQGSDLLARSRRQGEPVEQLNLDAENWFSAAQTFLSNNLGREYWSRFVHATGPLMFPIGRTLPESQLSIWRNLFYKVEYLKKFMEELSRN